MANTELHDHLLELRLTSTSNDSAIWSAIFNILHKIESLEKAIQDDTQTRPNTNQ